MHERNAAHAARCYLNIGDLAGHANDKGKVGKIKVIRGVFAGKNKTASVPIPAWLIIVSVKNVSVTQTEDSLHNTPGENHGKQSKNQMHREMSPRLTFVDANQKSNR